MCPVVSASSHSTTSSRTLTSLILFDILKAESAKARAKAALMASASQTGSARLNAPTPNSELIRAPQLPS